MIYDNKNLRINTVIISDNGWTYFTLHMFDTFCHIVADSCAVNKDSSLGNSGLG